MVTFSLRSHPRAFDRVGRLPKYNGSRLSCGQSIGVPRVRTEAEEEGRGGRGG